MSIAGPVAGECALHQGTPADWACQRCGTFVCQACERRTRPDAAPLCPTCWDLRSQVVKEQKRTDSRRLQVAGLVLGIASFLHPFVMVASLVLNIRELVRGTGGASRWMNVTGVAFTGLAVLTWTALILFAVTR